MSEIIIRRTTDNNEKIGAFLNEGFTRYRKVNRSESAQLYILFKVRTRLKPAAPYYRQEEKNGTRRVDKDWGEKSS